MTVYELETRCLERCGELPGAAVGNQYYVGSEALAALNAAQRVFVLISLCLENTGTLTLTPGVAFYGMLDVFADWLLPLRVRSPKEKVWPARFSDLGALNATWSMAVGDPIKYALHGFGLMGVYKIPATPATLSITYARCPAPLVNTFDVPEIPEEYHPALIDGALPIMRSKEGGREWQKTLPMWQRFVSEARRLGDYMRTRNNEQGYDYMPAEIARYDLSTKPGNHAQ